MSNYLSTEELCQKLKVKPGTARRALCANGHYMGIKPIKLPNGRLLWPDVEPDKLQICNKSK